VVSYAPAKKGRSRRPIAKPFAALLAAVGGDSDRQPGLNGRVSTSDQLTLTMQMRALQEYAARHCWTIAMQVLEMG
jgi:hypothetical protein